MILVTQSTTDTNSSPCLLKADEAAARIGVTVRYIRRLVAERKIPYYKVGKFVRFSAADIDQWLEERRVDCSIGEHSN